MDPERLTDLRSTNPPRPGPEILPGDVVRFERREPFYISPDEPRTVTDEGIVQSAPATLTDAFMRPVFTVHDVTGTPWYPLQAECTRVDPPQTQETTPIRPLDDCKEH